MTEVVYPHLERMGRRILALLWPKYQSQPQTPTLHLRNHCPPQRLISKTDFLHLILSNAVKWSSWWSDMDYDIVADAAYDASIGPCVPLFGKAFSSKHSQTFIPVTYNR
jgi:hypothetical protein